MPLDYPETDDESDPVSQIDWASADRDRTVHGANAAGTPGSEGNVPPGAVISHNRRVCMLQGLELLSGHLSVHAFTLPWSAPANLKVEVQ